MKLGRSTVLPLQLLGFPVQLIGVLSLPVLGMRYLVDKEDIGKDVEKYSVSGVCCEPVADHGISYDAYGQP